MRHCPAGRRAGVRALVSLPYREISGERELFLLVVVDVILGPLITLDVFNRAKPWSKLRRDLATMAALEGLSLSARPDLWQPYASAKSEILQVAKPVSDLKTRFPLQAAAMDAVIARSGHAPATLAYLPMVGRKSFWTVFLDPATAEVVAFMPLGSF